MNGNGSPPWPEALLRLHEAARARGENPFVTKVVEVGTPTPPMEFVIPKPDWAAILAQERAAERAAKLAEAAALLELEPAEEPPKPTPPAPKSRWRRSAP
jgi:hypothetical protein